MNGNEIKCKAKKHLPEARKTMLVIVVTLFLDIVQKQIKYYEFVFRTLCRYNFQCIPIDYCIAIFIE